MGHKPEEKHKDIIRLIAEILRGLQAPRGLCPGLLGLAEKPFDELRDRLDLFGYPDVEKHEEKLREFIKEKLKSE